jgi:hemoglobin
VLTGEPGAGGFVRCTWARTRSVRAVQAVESVFERVGGVEFFEHLVNGFYNRVKDDAVLLALYPDPADLSGARWRLTWFLVQYFGGPTVYSDLRGHPRLRMRHHPYAIGPLERDHWLAAMRGALVEVGPEPADATALWDYFATAAEAMRNCD